VRLSPTRLFVAEAGCLWPFRADVQPPPEKENAKMRRGKEVHRGIELRILGGPPNPMSKHHELVEHAFAWQRERGDGARHAETAFGVDLQSGSVMVFENKDKVPKDWMPVVVDLAILADTPEAWDFKTGSPFSSFDYRPQAIANAYAVATYVDREAAVAGLAYVTPEGIKAKSWDLDAFDLIEQKQKLRMWAAQAPTAQPNPGAACKYCPARGICPAMAAKESA
jgi:hypothetical protein